MIEPANLHRASKSLGGWPKFSFNVWNRFNNTKTKYLWLAFKTLLFHALIPTNRLALQKRLADDRTSKPK